jgi:hypothetical protein
VRIPHEIFGDLNMLNLTQHNASNEQIEAGVIEPSLEIKNKIVQLLTFGELPSRNELTIRARKIALLVVDSKVNSAMIGGAPFFMTSLESALIENGIVPFFAYSNRISEDALQEDGSTKKVSIFKHLGFVKSTLHNEDETTIKSLEWKLTVRTASILRAENVLTVGELLKMNQTQLSKIPNFGKKSLKELQDIFAYSF